MAAVYQGVGAGARMGVAGALRLALEAFGQVLQLVQHFGKGRELITLQCFVKYLR